MVMCWKLSILAVCLVACFNVPSVRSDDKDSAARRSTTTQELRKLELRLLENYTGKKKDKPKSRSKVEIPEDSSVFSTLESSRRRLPEYYQPDLYETPSYDDMDKEKEPENWILPPAPEFGEDEEFSPFVPYGKEFMEKLGEDTEAESVFDKLTKDEQSSESSPGSSSALDSILQKETDSRSDFLSLLLDRDTPSEEELSHEEMVAEEEIEEEQDPDMDEEFESEYEPVIGNSLFLSLENGENTEAGMSTGVLGSEPLEEASAKTAAQESFFVRLPEEEEEEEEEAEDFQFEFRERLDGNREGFRIALSERLESEEEEGPDESDPFWRTQEAIRLIMGTAGSTPASSDDPGNSADRASEYPSSGQSPSFANTSRILQQNRGSQALDESIASYGIGMGFSTEKDGAGTGSAFSGDAFQGAASGAGFLPESYPGSAGNTGLSGATIPDAGSVLNLGGGNGGFSWSPAGSSIGSSFNSFQPSRSPIGTTPSSSPVPVNRKRQGLDARTIKPLLQ